MSAELPRISATNITPSTDEIHVWTNVSERPTGDDMDNEREKSVSFIYMILYTFVECDHFIIKYFDLKLIKKIYTKNK